MFRGIDDALVVRAAVCRPDHLGPWPDLSHPDAVAGWRPWLRRALEVPGFGVALAHASPELAARITAALDGNLSQADNRRVVLAVMRYLLRATTRPTPYGLFAGTAPAVAARTGSARVGVGHRLAARIPAAWLSAVLDRIEADPRVRPLLLVRVNNLLVERGTQFVLEHRASQAPRGAPLHVRVRATMVVRAALALAAEPIRWGDLTDKLAAEHRAPPGAADRLIGQLVSQRLLVSSLRPPSTATDPLTHLINQLERLDADGTAVGEVLTPLRQVREKKIRHDGTPDGAVAAVHRRDLDTTAAGVVAGAPPVGVDLRVDCELVLPRTVTAEACRAATALARLARPTTVEWTQWHARFLDRYGLHALVPVRDAVDADVGIGYPAGFTGAAPAAPAAVTDRDRALLALAQRAALHREREINLTDGLLGALAGRAPVDVSPSAELTVRVHARTVEAVADGDFMLSVVRAGGPAFGTAGRVLDMFDESEFQRLAARVAAVQARAGDVLLAQLSAPTRYTVSLDVARARRLLPYVIPVGEYHETAPDVIGVDDIAVTADAHRLYLVSISRQRALLPMLVNAVERNRHALPIVRFLAEAPTALATACAPFDWGPAARDLPFLPAVRHGRTLLSRARWLLPVTDLPPPIVGGKEWDDALARWLQATGCPPEVSLGFGDQTLGLDLGEPAHRTLLRDHLRRTGTGVLRAAPGGSDWIGGHPHEIVIPLVATTPPPPPPRLTHQVIDVREHGTLPGDPDHRYLKVYARPDQQTCILTDHLPGLLGHLAPEGSWWFQRFIDPQPHLRLRLRGLPVETITAWSRQLVDADLTRRIQWDTDFPEPGRFGGPAAYHTTVGVFAADSSAALAQLSVTSHRHAPHWRALTAASMVDLATAVIGDPYQAMYWLIMHARAHRPAPERAVYDQAVRLANPHDHHAVAALPDGKRLLACWQQRRQIAAAWRDTLPDHSTTEPADLLPDLLHLHHVRIAGPDLDSERACLHLARAAALSWTTRSPS
ncbi:lantibiotic dehydratase [Micromonospora sp. WMMD1082]|uniref:lantibiotic dehydratase n=1 Tax=Micromonospora sp. WMMD1082 TaxID=3016104 RepID=UPI0024160D85|nr:lantibiotic dehydratase [Micromonospora sp. WMMD1082]MDG4795151.1 lantibiotic dehydratase [Micromonospora sp. WMMD1082]